MNEMDKIWKKKEWLRDCTDIPVKMGKGRLSGKHHEALTAAVARGVRFSDYSPVVTETVTKGETEVVRVVRDKTVNVVDPANTQWLNSDEYRFPEAEYKAVADDKTVYGMREACNTCGLSLLNHKCESPSVLGKPVRIVAR